MRQKQEKGQILLIVILVVVVVSTIGLSIGSRSIINLRTSTEQEDAQKALAAAEEGIERALQSSNAGQTITGVNFASEAIEVGGDEISLNGGNIVAKNEGIDIWFKPHNPDGSLGASINPSNLNLYWGSPGETCSDSAAIQAIVVTDDGSSIRTYRYAYDNCSSRRTDNRFTNGDTGSYSIASKTFPNKTPNNHLASGLTNIVFMRVVPLYNDTVIAAENGTAFPGQGLQITSTGNVSTAQRKLVVFKSYPQTYLPYISYGLFVAN